MYPQQKKSYFRNSDIFFLNLTRKFNPKPVIVFSYEDMKYLEDNTTKIPNIENDVLSRWESYAAFALTRAFLNDEMSFETILKNLFRSTNEYTFDGDTYHLSYLKDSEENFTTKIAWIFFCVVDSKHPNYISTRLRYKIYYVLSSLFTTLDNFFMDYTKEFDILFNFVNHSFDQEAYDNEIIRRNIKFMYQFLLYEDTMSYLKHFENAL